MNKMVRRLLFGVTLLVLLSVLLGWLVLRASLPRLDGDILVTSLTDVVTINRDSAGIPVISASSRVDLAFATGFAHGQDRFFQMDLIRRQPAGELSEIFGAVAINSDKSYRFHRFRARAKAVVATVTDAEREFLQRYADGVNAGRESLSARPFEYFVLGVEPAPWQVEDSILAVYQMFLQLNDSRARKEVRRGLARKVGERLGWLPVFPTTEDAARCDGLQRS